MTMRSEMLCDVTPSPVFCAQLNRLEPGDIILIVEHKPNRARLLINTERSPR